MTASTDSTLTFAQLLANNGMTAEHKARLTVAPSVVKALSDTKVAQVVVLASEAFDGTNDTFVNQLHTVPNVTTIEVRDSEATRIRAHVASFAKTRKVAMTITPLKSAEGLIGYVFRRDSK